MVQLRRVPAATAATSAARSRPLGDPPLDPRTAAYLEPATVPVSPPAPRQQSRDLRGLWLAGIHRMSAARSIAAQRPYPRLWSGMLLLLLLLLYLLVYAQQTGSPRSPYLIILPPGVQAGFEGAPLAVPLDEVPPVPLTGK
jgi:hypothetical protein